MADSEPQASNDTASTGPPLTWADALPSLALPAGTSAEAAIDVLERRSRRGRLPGFQRTGTSACTFAAHGSIYDRTVLVSPAPPREDGSHRLAFAARLDRKFPVIVIAALVLALFPGVVLTHSLLDVYFGWYSIGFWWTFAWYVPLTLLAVPVLWKQFKASELASRAHAEQTITTIADQLDARIEPAYT